MTMAPPIAGHQPVTVKPMSNWSASQPVRRSSAALITSRNSPSVTMMKGIERIVRIGFTNEVTTPRISETSSSGTSFS